MSTQTSTFDYAKAWREVAGPAYRSLDPKVAAVVRAVADRCDGLSQLPDLSQRWPDDGGELRAMFDGLDSETLSLAARVVYFAGHWYPGTLKAQEQTNVAGSKHGAHWKFAHYADQVLRSRFGLPESGDSFHGNGPAIAITDGAFRLQYSSADTWTWVEVSPATDDGHTTAKDLRAKLAIVSAQAGKRERENKVFAFFEDLKANGPTWPDPWKPFADTSAYMVHESDLEILPEERTAAIAKERVDIERRYSDDSRKATENRTAALWCLDHGLTTDNVIFYHHTGILTFGWRSKCGPVEVSRILDVISEWPGAYEIQGADRVYRNADAEMVTA